MKCTTEGCEAEIVRRHNPYTYETLVGFENIPGHCHNNNCMSRTYKCSNDHVSSLLLRRRCHACDWVGKDHCDICPGTFVDAWPEVAA